MAKNKTIETENDVMNYLTGIQDKRRRADCMEISDIFTQESGYPAKMWGTAIVGFGSYHYRYESGHQGDAPLAGFSSRANAITLYLSLEEEQKQAFLLKPGKYKSGKGCIYIKKLNDIDVTTLRTMIRLSVEFLQNKYPGN